MCEEINLKIKILIKCQQFLACVAAAAAAFYQSKNE